VADKIVSRVFPRWLDENDGFAEEELDTPALLSSIERFSSHCALRPSYDAETLDWLIAKSEQFKERGDLQRVSLRDDTGEVIGVYMYYLEKSERAGNVLLVAAQERTIGRVLDHLFRHAWMRGAVSLSGRLHPRFMREMSSRRCRFNNDGGWTMVHSINSDLLQAIYRGDAWLSRLEGEGPLLPRQPLRNS
jgi:hypothetical protein